MYVFLYALYVCELDDFRAQKALDPLEPELQMVVSHHVGSGNQPGVL